MRRTFAAVWLLGLSAAFVIQSTPSDGSNLTSKSASDELEIRGTLQTFADAWNTHDAHAFSQVFAADADFTNVNGIHAHGRAEVEKFHAPLFATHFRYSHLRILDVRLRMIKSDVAAVDATWEMTGARSRTGQEIPLRKGLLIFVMTRENGRWLIKVMHNMELHGPPQG
jgi:uncharacterized protein (TIGR02246 family)